MRVAQLAPVGDELPAARTRVPLIVQRDASGEASLEVRLTDVAPQNGVNRFDRRSCRRFGAVADRVLLSRHIELRPSDVATLRLPYLRHRKSGRIKSPLRVASGGRAWRPGSERPWGRLYMDNRFALLTTAARRHAAIASTRCARTAASEVLLRSGLLHSVDDFLGVH